MSTLTNLIRIQWGSEYRTGSVFRWLEPVRFPNGSDFEPWLEIRTFQMVLFRSEQNGTFEFRTSTWDGSSKIRTPPPSLDHFIRTKKIIYKRTQLSALNGTEQNHGTGRSKSEPFEFRTATWFGLRNGPDFGVWISDPHCILVIGLTFF
jgi:hypothetical protein